MSESPTPSPIVNTIIDMATRVANREAESEPLRKFLEGKLAETKLGRQGFRQKLLFHDEGFVAHHEAEIEAVLDGFDAYDAAMLHMLGFFQDGRVETLLEANDKLIAVASILHQALQAYGLAFTNYGPSRYPVMNAARNILRTIHLGENHPKALQDFVASACQTYDQAISEIDASAHGQSEGYQTKRKAYQELKAALNELKPTHPDELDSLLRPLQLALEAKTIADEKIFAENTALAPTKLPAANVLINAFRGALAEHVELETLEEVLEWYEAYNDDLEKQFEEALEGETNSVLIMEELPKTRNLMDEHEELIEQLHEALDEFEEETVEPILEELIDLIEKLEASAEVYKEAAEREGQIVCIKCGHGNAPNNRSCEKCGTQLPKLIDPAQFRSTFEVEERSGLEGEDDPDQFRLGDKVLRLFEACYQFYEGQIQTEDFQAYIDSSRADLQKSEEAAELLTREIEGEKIDSDDPEARAAFEESMEAVGETRELLLDGIDQFADGLEDLEDYIESRRRATIERGIQKIFMASQKLYKVKRLGEVADETLAELADSPAPNPEAAPTVESTKAPPEPEVEVESDFGDETPKGGTLA